ncbi:xylose isomerase-like protein [Calycina marina]|uniref:Xylose isomerase-like protein n=1 Tax=Calycina marina TaxID=1763456 RepID=A0A9P7Z861_9HELO|nr:xylose isomerase-like protein [Calycina marina]
MSPFSNYELNFEILEALGADLIHTPSTVQNSEGLTGDLKVVARDLRVLSELRESNVPKLRFTYENLSFETWTNGWGDTWEAVKRVDKANFGLCMDTFHITGWSYGDLTAPSGKFGHAADEFDETVGMVREIDPKIFYVQMVDMERIVSPLVKGHAFCVEGQRLRISWSRNARLFMYEED